MKLTARVLLPLACIVAFSATAEGAIVYNGSPSFQKTGDFFGTHNVLPSLTNGGGFYLIQNAAQAEEVVNFGPGESFTMPAQPTSSMLSSYSDSYFVFANVGDTITSTSFSTNQLSLNNGSGYYVGFKVTDVDNGSAVYKGWFQVTVSGVGTLGTVSFTLNEYAYDDTGASILVGNTGLIPEASTYSLAAGGLALAGVLVRRRRTSKQA